MRLGFDAMLRLRTNRPAKEAIARACFYGLHPRLSDHVLEVLGYRESGQWFPATGADLADYVRVICEMGWDQINALTDAVNVAECV